MVTSMVASPGPFRWSGQAAQRRWRLGALALGLLTACHTSVERDGPAARSPGAADRPSDAPAASAEVTAAQVTSAQATSAQAPGPILAPPEGLEVRASRLGDTWALRIRNHGPQGVRLAEQAHLQPGGQPVCLATACGSAEACRPLAPGAEVALEPLRSMAAQGGVGPMVPADAERLRIRICSAQASQQFEVALSVP